LCIGAPNRRFYYYDIDVQFHQKPVVFVRESKLYDVFIFLLLGTNLFFRINLSIDNQMQMPIISSEKRRIRRIV